MWCRVKKWHKAKINSGFYREIFWWKGAFNHSANAWKFDSTNLLNGAETCFILLTCWWNEDERTQKEREKYRPGSFTLASLNCIELHLQLQTWFEPVDWNQTEFNVNELEKASRLRQNDHVNGREAKWHKPINGNTSLYFEQLAKMRWLLTLCKR